MSAEQLDQLRAAIGYRYRIIRELGRGGMATVYLADDLKHDRRVALKVLLRSIAAAIGPERFLREIKLTAQLNHPDRSGRSIRRRCSTGTGRCAGRPSSAWESITWRRGATST